ncbi:MAG: hypothetical protein AAGB48_06215 [Planctomycetota bacterium]
MLNPAPDNPDAFPPSIAVSLRGLAPAYGGVRSALHALAGSGLRAAALDAASPETRPRLLSRSDRRDLAAALRRAELAAAGLDLLIRSEAWSDPAESDRAVAAGVEAIRLASDLRALDAAEQLPVLCVSLPAEGAQPAADTLNAEAGRHGVLVAAVGEHLGNEEDQAEASRVARSARLTRLSGSGDTPSAAAERVIELGPSLAQLRIDSAEPEVLAALAGCVPAMSVACRGATGVIDCFAGAGRTRAESMLVRCITAWLAAAL